MIRKDSIRALQLNELFVVEVLNYDPSVKIPQGSRTQRNDQYRRQIQ